jgi:hypothetical protein
MCKPTPVALRRSKFRQNNAAIPSERQHDENASYAGAFSF